MNEGDLDKIRELITYDPETGDFMFLVKRGKSKVGEKAGSPHNNGYWKIGLFNKKFLAHRLAWAMYHGEWPTTGIDHRDGDKLNNRISNLRPATKSQNAANTPGFSRKGIRYDPRQKEGNRYVARIEHSGKRIHLGSFATQELAEEFRALAAEMIFGEYIRD